MEFAPEGNIDVNFYINQTTYILLGVLVASYDNPECTPSMYTTYISDFIALQ
jgi:hypothetical protein